MQPIDPALLTHVTGGDPEPSPWITLYSWTILTIPPVSVVPGPMIGGFRP
jgi:hypothetical protein